MDTNLQRQFETKELATVDLTKEMLPIIDSNGDFKEVTGKDAIIAQIRNLLMTPLGTFPFDSEYGSLLYKQLFEPMNETTERQIYYECRQRILMYIEDVDVDSVEMEWIEKNKICRVDVYFYIKDEKNRTKLSLFMQSYGNAMYNSIDDPEYKDYMF